MEQKKQNQDRKYEFTKEERRLLTECHDNKEEMSVNIDYVSKLISVVNSKTGESRVIGGINVPTMGKAFESLDVIVTYNPTQNNNRKNNKRGDHEKKTH